MPLTDPIQGLAQAVDEAATVPAPAGAGLRRVGDVIAAIAAASHEMRLAYWGYPHPGSVGDQPLVILADGREFIVSRVAFEKNRIQVDAEPLTAGPAGDG